MLSHARQKVDAGSEGDIVVTIDVLVARQVEVIESAKRGSA